MSYYPLPPGHLTVQVLELDEFLQKAHRKAEAVILFEGNAQKASIGDEATMAGRGGSDKVVHVRLYDGASNSILGSVDVHPLETAIGRHAKRNKGIWYPLHGGEAGKIKLHLDWAARSSDEAEEEEAQANQSEVEAAVDQSVQAPISEAPQSQSPGEQASQEEPAAQSHKSESVEAGVGIPPVSSEPALTTGVAPPADARQGPQAAGTEPSPSAQPDTAKPTRIWFTSTTGVYGAAKKTYSVVTARVPVVSFWARSMESSFDFFADGTCRVLGAKDPHIRGSVDRGVLRILEAVDKKVVDPVMNPIAQTASNAKDAVYRRWAGVCGWLAGSDPFPHRAQSGVAATSTKAESTKSWLGDMANKGGQVMSHLLGAKGTATRAEAEAELATPGKGSVKSVPGQEGQRSPLH